MAHESKVFAVEPDKDMMRIIEDNLRNFPNCVPMGSTAEDTGIKANSVDLIFCGNSYHWFDRDKVIPEFKRILRGGMGKPNILISSLGPYNNQTPSQQSDFKDGKFIEKIFDYTVHNNFNEFLHGSLSASNVPRSRDDGFEEYCDSLKQFFEKHGVNGKMETKFRLFCVMGNVGGLIQ